MEHQEKCHLKQNVGSTEMEQLELFNDVTLEESNDYLPQLDIKAIHQFATEQALRHWQRKFTGKIKLLDSKWRRRAGCYYANEETIELSKYRNKLMNWEDVKGVILHELVHWHMHTSKQPYHDDDIEFALECLRVGAPISSTKIAHKAARLAKYSLKTKLEKESCT